MKTRVGRITRFPRKCSLGFSLVELLLAVALLLLLLGAVVFNFSSLQQNAELEEGTTQFESLIRYARAHAANTGRKVRLTFEEDAGDGLLVPLGNFSVSWEPDPLGQPDQFAALPETADFVKSILDVVSIENVVTLANATSPGPPADGTADPAGARDNAGAAQQESSVFGFPPILFYPDGSCDSAEIIIAARNNEETRKMALRLVGLTGSIHRRTISAEASPAAAEPPAPSATAARPAGQENAP